MPDMHRIIYCSRSRMTGARAAVDAEISRILARSRANNAAASVGGALLFSDDCFAQVLEGPQDSLARIFERIQRDTRHSDVLVLGSEPALSRDFPSWSMAYAGTPDTAGRRKLARITLEAAFASRTSDSGHAILNLLRHVVGEAVAA